MNDPRPAPARADPTHAVPAGAAPPRACAWPAPAGARLTLAAADRADLALVRAHVRRGCLAAGAAAAACGELALAADEVCTNVLAHGYGGPGPLTVDVAAGAGAVRVTVADAAPAFDPTRDPAADRAPSTGPLGARVPGGLGWALVRASVDRLAYARVGACNVVTLERACRGAPPPSSQPPARMDISLAHDGDVTIVSPAGSLDALTADALGDVLQAQLGAGRTRLVVALAALDYTSSAGLRSLLAGAQGARGRGGDLRVAGAQGGVLRVLDVTGFTSILRCYPDVPSAVASWAA